MKSIVKNTLKVCFLIGSEEKNLEILFRFSAILPSVMDCSSKEVHLIVILNDIHSDDVSLGDAHCKAYWSNETHAKFHADIDNCSLVKSHEK